MGLKVAAFLMLLVSPSLSLCQETAIGGRILDPNGGALRNAAVVGVRIPSYATIILTYRFHQ